MKKFSFVSCLTLALLMPHVATAHEGHGHNVMGTVKAVHPGHIVITTKEGKETGITLDDKTVYVKKAEEGTAPATVKDVIEGVRVVVDVTGEEDKLSATRVLISGKATAKAKPKESDEGTEHKDHK